MFVGQADEALVNIDVWLLQDLILPMWNRQLACLKARGLGGDDQSPGGLQLGCDTQPDRLKCDIVE